MTRRVSDLQRGHSARAVFLSLLTRTVEINCSGCALVTVALTLVVVVVSVIAAADAGRFLTVADTVAPGDAVVVLGGDSDDFRRTRYAVDLFQQGFAGAIVLNGGPSDYAGLAGSTTRRAQAVLQELGVRSDAVTLMYDTHSTYDDALKIRQLTQEKDWESLIIVTDSFHTRRAARTFRTLLPNVAVSVAATPYARPSVNHWWATEDGFISVLTEILKLGFYWFRYGVRPVEISGAAGDSSKPPEHTLISPRSNPAPISTPCPTLTRCRAGRRWRASAPCIACQLIQWNING